MPTTKPYRSPRNTPKPIVQGPQTALVVGPSGEEIHCDEFGRIKVQFYWDREGSKDENSSCWIRISNAWAGKNWGSIHIPRIGHEVVVSFLEGDPDKPLVTGSVYNADNMPPYELAAHKTQSGIKSRSSKEGNKDNFNEIRFEDEKGKEELRIQAEKDMNIGVKNIRKTFIGSALDEEGTGEKHKDCPDIGEMNEQLTVFADRETFIKGNDTLKIAEEGQASKGRVMTVFNGHHDLTVNKGDQNISIKQGDITRKVDMGKVLEQATKSIEFKVGGSSIKIEPAKITIKSTMIEINGQSMVDVKSIKTSVAGSAMVEVKGGIVKIN
jgi:type VI secretion system secreted protein VgrG